VSEPSLEEPVPGEPVVDAPVVDAHVVDDEQRRTLWRTAWGVVLAASGAFSLGYGMSRAADPSVGASRPPLWPLFISLAVVAVSLWFVLAPTLQRWPFEACAEPPDQPAR
jgi:hypothetical protein